jgi:hypothetical protein
VIPDGLHFDEQVIVPAPAGFTAAALR